MKPNQPQNQLAPNDPAFYRELLDHISDGVYIVDRERRILYWNEGAHRLTGYKAEELLGRCCQDDILCHVDPAGKRLCHEGCPLTASMADGCLHEASVFLRHKHGGRVPVKVRVQPMRDSEGSIVGAVEIFSDDSAHNDALRRAEAMKRLAFFDDLVELPNRRFLEMSVRTALSEFEVHKDTFGVLLMDMNRFKSINDSFGHNYGDRALQEVARTLSGALRPTDIVGRWGGDEFLAIAHNVDHENLSKLAGRCAALVAETSIANDDKRRISLSIAVGAALVRAGETPENLIHRADRQMYQSKENPRGHAAVE